MTLQETIDACDKLREESEGVGLSDSLVQIVEFAYWKGYNEMFFKAYITEDES